MDESPSSNKIALFSDENSAIKCFVARAPKQLCYLTKSLANKVNTIYRIDFISCYGNKYRIDNYKEFKSIIEIVSLNVNYNII